MSKKAKSAETVISVPETDPAPIKTEVYYGLRGLFAPAIAGYVRVLKDGTLKIEQSGDKSAEYVSKYLSLNMVQPIVSGHPISVREEGAVEELPDDYRREAEVLVAMVDNRIAETIQLREESDRLSDELRQVMVKLRAA